ncbi:MAG: phenylalanyl-tRNA synthetase beta chain [Verrucomicrobiales bacterium]|jgi:phenylalanyl-tRNA synthetase beta chain
MKVSLNWLNDHLDLSDKSIDEMADLLTFAGIEVEGIQQLPAELVVAEVKSSDPHPGADKLSVCQVDDGSDSPRQIVCGAKNYKVGDKVPLALPGAKFGDYEINEGELRGVESRGMMCSAKELNLSDDADGLMILPNDLKPGTPMREVYPPVYEIEVTPNRPDQLSHLGIGRELGALLGQRIRKKSHDKIKTPTRPAKPDEIKISDTETCPFYTGRIIRGVKVKPSPAWLQEKLNSVGLRPINNLVDITNYVLMEMGQPLHVFDLAKLDGGIHVRRAAAGEKFLALDGETYELSDVDCVIGDSKEPHAIGGVMGGEDSGVTETTTDILLEAAYFTPSFIRRTSHRLLLHSDSSYRFERGVDPAQVLGASELAAKLIKKLAKGTADEEILIAGELPETEFTVPLDNKHVCRLIGHDLSNKEIADILKSLGLKKKKDGWEIPTWRLDLRRSVDLIEEVARVYGLDRLESKQIAPFASTSKSDRDFDFRRQVRQHLTRVGFCECQTIKMISESQLADDVVTQHRNMTPIRVKNPMTDTHSILRPGLTPSLIRIAEHNVRMGLSSLRLFEIGTTFIANPKGMAIEQPHLALLFTGAREDAAWQQPKPDLADIHAMRGVLESLCGRPVTFKPVKDERLLLAAEISIGKTKVGLAGQLWPKRTRELDLDQPVIVAELTLKKLASALSEPARFTELPKFPAITRDVAIEAPAELTNQEIADFFGSTGQQLLESFALFDVFADPSGEKLAADRKSLAYSLTYRDLGGTLESATVDAAHAEILDGLKKTLPVQFR